MNILIIGDEKNLDECRQKLGDRHSYSHANEHRHAQKLFSSNELIIDFIIEEEPEAFELYKSFAGPVMLNTVKVSLAALANPANFFPKNVFGFNGLPTFFNRSLLEVSVLHHDATAGLKALCEKLNCEYKLVDDRVGMVTPRVVCMIINEAYYTVAEGTASREDIDLAMKLGTNYPYGPFEWCSRIGIRHVYEVLDALYEDTKDERYKICPLLKHEYLRISQ